MVELYSNYPEHFAVRYRRERRLGRGANASVHSVVDERSGQRYALKRLEVAGEQGSTARAMFEREYYSLVQLAHPHIVRVFDFGLDGDKPFYTLELLPGQDARASVVAGALEVRQACMLLRDCASALALIHSRGMVHRDVSPRNLWCMPDGRAKLIDFGTLVAMGPQTRIAGTPPFVPPEAVNLQPLDARSDLYALGALGYFLLTGKIAYPARSLSGLRQVWQHAPARPAQLRAEVGHALSDLVMALLSLDPRGRPGSAADVYDRLTALAALPVEDEQQLAQAFLTAPSLVGPSAPSELWQRRMQRALSGRGSTIALTGEAGLGRSRVLSSWVLGAKLTGTPTVLLDANTLSAEPLGLGRALVEQLLDASPLTAADGVTLGPVLGHLSPDVHRAFGSPELAEFEASKRIGSLDAAITQLLDQFTRKQALMIAVDDVHCADSASLVLLGRLSLLAPDRRLLLALSADSAALAQAPPALERLLTTRHTIQLSPLSASETHSLLESLFGAAPGLETAATWLYEASQGNPQTCMQYAQYLVDRGVAKYARGKWSLPADLSACGLPATLGAMFDARVQALSEDARALALGLALARDDSRASWQPETHLHIADYAKLLGSGESGRAFAALDELLRACIVQQRDSAYVLTQRPIIDALLRATSEDTRKRAHQRLGEIFNQPSYPGSGYLMAVHHLQLADEDEAAKQLLLEATARNNSSGINWGALRVSLTAACSKRALAYWQKQAGPAREGITLRGALLSISSVYDWSNASVLDAQLAQLRADSGLIHWEQTDPTDADLQRVLACMQLAQRTYDETPEATRGSAPLDALRELAASCISSVGAFVNAHDIAHVRALVEVLGPLKALSPIVALIAEMCALAERRVTGRELGDGLIDIADRLLGATGIPETLRHGAAAINVHIQCLEDARRGRASAVSRMDHEAHPRYEQMYLLVHGLWIAHAFGGQAALAQRYRREAELVPKDDVWRPRAYLFIEAELYALTGDLQDLSRAHARLAELATTFAGLQPWAAFAQGSLHQLRGNLEEAQRAFELGLSLAQPGEHRAFVRLAPAYAEVLLARGDTEGALRQVLQLREAVEHFELDASASVAAERIQALIESAAGQHAAALDCLERAFADAGRLDFGGLPLAVLWQAKARIALAAGDAAACSAALTQLQALIKDAHAPALVQAYEALRADSQRTLEMRDVPSIETLTHSNLTEAGTLFNEMQTQLRSFETSSERAQRALELLLEHCGAQTGYLLFVDEHGVRSGAFRGASEPSGSVLNYARTYLDTQVIDVQTVTASASVDADETALRLDAEVFSPVVLASRDEAGATVAALALVGVEPGRLRTPALELVQIISDCLLASGDSHGLRLAD